jgi:membrane fusion protein (multidrug efflux system)
MTEPGEAQPTPVAPHPSEAAPSEPPSSGIFAFVAGLVLLGGAGLLAATMLGGAEDDGLGTKGGGGGWGGRGGGASTGPAAVRVHDVEVGSLTQQRRVPGEVFVRRRATLRARSTGEVTRLAVQLGGEVKAGELIAALDPGTLPAEVARAQALVAAAKARTARARAVLAQAIREQKRTEDLATQKAASTSELEAAAAAVALAEADVAIGLAEEDRAAADLAVLQVRQRQTRVTAPFSGRVALLNVEQGTMMSAGEPVAVVIANEAPRVRFAVGESEATVLRLGAPVQVRIGDVRVAGEIDALGAEVEPESRTLAVEAALKEVPEGAQILPGTFVEVEVALGATESATVVPLEALLGSGPMRKLIVVEQGKARVVETRVLLEDGQRAAVSGVTQGQRVVVGGLEGLEDGADVEVVQ